MNTSVTSLGGLQSVGTLSTENNPLASLGSLKTVKKDLILMGCPITSLGGLQSVGETLSLKDTEVSQIEEGLSPRNLYLNGTPVCDVSKLKGIGSVGIDGFGIVALKRAKGIFRSYREEVSKKDKEDLPRLAHQAEHKWQQAIIKDHMKERG